MARLRFLSLVLLAAGCLPTPPGRYYFSSDDGAAPDDAASDDVRDLAAVPPPPDIAKPEGPCGIVPTTGMCVGAGRVDRCVLPTGQGEPTVVSRTCESYEECRVESGIADCYLRPGACRPGADQCTGPNTRQVCVDGAWRSENCPGCQAGQLGTVCTGGVATKVYTGRFLYEARGPAQNYTDWSANVFNASAQGALVVSYVHDAGKNKDVVIDSTTTDVNGSYTIRIPSQPGPDDVIYIWAVRPKTGGIGKGLAFAVAEPDVPNGMWNVQNPIPGGEDAYYWGWGYYTDSLGAPGSTITIREADGSGAFRVFDYLRYVYNSVEDLTGSSGGPVIIWLRYNSSWDCGACFYSVPYSLAGFDFKSQIFIPATAQDTSYWSDPVTAHELGHWVMWAYGVSPGEGGPHQVGCPTYPGQAWSEGWATAFSGLARAVARYYDKQRGTFFWFDIDRRVYGDGVLWQRPVPGNGLLQLIDENEVASMIWAMSLNPTVANKSLDSNVAFLDALQSARLTTPPYGRAYTQHTWTGACQRTNIVDQRRSVPMFADFLDALVCAGMPPARVDAATQWQFYYPYRSNSPICP